MAKEWQKVARWAGIGNNGREGNLHRSSKEMVEEKTVQQADAGESSASLQAGANLEFDAAEVGVAKAADVGSKATSDTPATSTDAALLDELEKTRGERDKLMDRLARLQAEFENTRRREAKERSDLRDYAVQSAVEPFLAVMDNFQLALKADGSVEQLRTGVELILKQMEEALKGLQVVAVETVGTQFDPRVHEALGSIETKEFPDHQVLEEIRCGYKIREKLLRPALVRIASNNAVVNE